jgi:hypothetical protein
VLCFNCNVARNNFGACHDGSPLDQTPPPTLSPTDSSGVEHGVRGAAPGPSQLQLPIQAP